MCGFSLNSGEKIVNRQCQCGGLNAGETQLYCDVMFVDTNIQHKYNCFTLLGMLYSEHMIWRMRLFVILRGKTYEATDYHI